MHSRGLLVVGGLLLVAVMAVAGAAVVLQSLRGQGAGAAPSSCSPAPCVAPQGMELHVDRIGRSGEDVLLEVHFVNHTAGGGFEATSMRHTGLADFSMRAGGSAVRPDIAETPPECVRWDDLEVPRGAASPARTVCFRVPAGASMTLTWSPDLGLVFRSVDLPLGKAP